MSANSTKNLKIYVSGCRKQELLSLLYSEFSQYLAQVTQLFAHTFKIPFNKQVYFQI